MTTPTVQNAVVDRIAGDLTLSTLLARHDEAPAAFPDVHVPADVGFPLIAVIVRSATSDGSKTAVGYDWRLLVRCFAGLKQQDLLDEVALRVRELFHHNPLDVGDMEGWLAVADMPTPVPVVNALCQDVAVRLRAQAPDTAYLSTEGLMLYEATDGGDWMTHEDGDPMLLEA